MLYDLRASVVNMSVGASYSGAREPSRHEWEELHTLSEILKWAGLNGCPSYTSSEQGSLLAALGADAFTSTEEFAAIPIEDYICVVDSVWLHGTSITQDDFLDTELKVNPSAMTRSRARSAHHTARLWAGVDITRDAKRLRVDDQEAKVQQYRDSKLAAMQVMSASSSSSANNGAPINGESVPINEIADTTQKREVPVMPHEKYRGYYRNYKKWTHVDPKPEITPSRAQLSVLLAILAAGSCYVDLALWGSYQGRAARAMRCEGFIPGPDGTQVRADFKGPPDYTCWHACFVVYMVAMIMLEQVLPPWLAAYIDIIAEYNSLYGPSNWAFLYQTDVRFRSEHLPFMLIHESDRLDAALTMGNTTLYIPSKPWGHLWKMACDTEEGSEARWWYKNFERRLGPVSAARDISGDARIATSAGGHFATTHNAVNVVDSDRSGTNFYNSGDGGGGKKQPTPAPSPSPSVFQKPAQPIIATKRGKGETLCTWYNAGTCKNSDGGKCPKDASLRHLCHWCLGNHPANTCGKVAGAAGKVDYKNQSKKGKKSGK